MSDFLTTFRTKEVTSFRIAYEFPEENNSIFLRNADTNLPITLSHSINSYVCAAGKIKEGKDGPAVMRNRTAHESDNLAMQ